MTIFLYILLGISSLAPIYTYVLYPFVLRFFKPRSRKTFNDYIPTVSVMIIGDDESKCKTKENNIRESDYKNIIEIRTVQNQIAAFTELNEMRGEIIVMTDDSSTYLNDTITNCIKPLSEPFVGCVCGMVRKRPNQKGEFCDGANWKYENRVKALESNIGCLSGANSAIYAFRKELTPQLIETKINLDFLIPTEITEIGFDVLFESQSIAYESNDRTETDLFRKHVADGASGYRSIVRFWRLLLPRKGSFVFWSHRVMKWLVPFNMLIFFIGSAILSVNHVWAFVLLVIQALLYFYLSVYCMKYIFKEREMPGLIGKISNFASYFVLLNVAWLLGFFKSFSR